MKIGVFYASMSGNTEAIADIIAGELKDQNHDVDLEDFMSVQSAAELLNYDLTFIGLYTWGDGDYPDECLDVIEEIEQLDLENHPFAIFGSGDTSYPEFCGALDHLQKLIEEQGGTVVGSPLRIEFNPEPEDEEEIKKFVSEALMLKETC
ncbi:MULTISPECIES: flavodoxin [Cytobacillus]|jgi:flavodoxin I|uniref:Flavodoxin n=3 Tax=Cytobacillus TaxID=2675230 RepID=A0A169FQF3_9BACI|nr:MULTISPECIES: flavodoxin [Cytobacillus]MBY0156477.1 flavodoxin [Cytobacillus firmus]AND40335.1 flavodoxin [Cytobacillus oceanisediminis 2691]MBU8732133.1 flavodoxin [Cytobacillus oceanisediminis]MCM3246260.1 flavodoxin [Cytobacillus oceanisediminis]MCM3392273.1 flavodoxin [Cytobacillus oceanisediminis]